MNVIDRFLDKVSPEPNTGCWLWVSNIDGGGYGQFWHEGRYRPAHRVAFELFVGPIDIKLQACHTCDVRCCVNPSHIFPGTRSENAQDMIRKKRQPNAKLTWETVAAIRAEYPRSTLKTLAANYGVCKARISRVVNNLIWVA